MLRTNTPNNNNHINGWPAKNGNGELVAKAQSPVKSLREEYFTNGTTPTTNGDSLKNHNNNNNILHQNNNNLNGNGGGVWSPVKSNGNGIGYSTSPAKTPVKDYQHANGYPTTATPFTDEPISPLVNGNSTAAQEEPAEEDQLIARNNHHNNNNLSNGQPAPQVTNGHHLHGNLRLMNGKVNGCLTPNGSAKQANGNSGALVDKECDESDPLTGSIVDTMLSKDTMKRRLDESDDDECNNEEARMRKEQAANGGGGGAGAGDGDDDDRICGIGSCRPKWATKLASTKVFMVVFLLAWVLQGMYSTYFVSVITTIEKLFQIQSKVTGVLLSVTEIGQISTALFLTYYAGRGHRPRWIACGE